MKLKKSELKKLVAETLKEAGSSWDRRRMNQAYMGVSNATKKARELQMEADTAIRYAMDVFAPNLGKGYGKIYKLGEKIGGNLKGLIEALQDLERYIRQF